MKRWHFSLVTIVAAVSFSSLAQDRPTFLVEFPLRINSSVGATGPKGQAELTVWTHGDSAFGLWRTLDEDSLRFDELHGVKEGKNVRLYSSVRSSPGRTSSGPASLDIRYEFLVTRWDDSLHAEMTLAAHSTGSRISSPTVNIYGRRAR